MSMKQRLEELWRAFNVPPDGHVIWAFDASRYQMANCRSAMAFPSPSPRWRTENNMRSSAIVTQIIPYEGLLHLPSK
jgi:hypothetical protein